jgi:hypothetical protein
VISLALSQLNTPCSGGKLSRIYETSGSLFALNLKGKECLVGCELCGASGDDHHGPRVATKKILEKVRELAVSVRNMLRFLLQSFHDISKSRETLVDVLSLF